MGLLDLLFRTKPPAPLPKGSVTVLLSGTVLKNEAGMLSEADEFSSLQDRLIEVLEATGTGLFDSNETGETGAKIFLYGEDADRLLEAIEPVLRTSVLSEHARVIVRQGGPGTTERSVQL